MVSKRTEASQLLQNDQSNKADGAEVEVECRDCDDPQWETALSALNGYERHGLGWVNSGKHNPRPLGDLLARGLFPPAEVLLALSNFMSPPEGYRGPRFVVELPKVRTILHSAAKMAKKRRARIRFEELRQNGHAYKNSIWQVASEFEKKRTEVTGLLKLSDKEIVYETSKWLGKAKRPPFG